MDELTLKRIETAHPTIREQLKEQYLEINKMLPVGCRLRFAYVYRTIEEQNKLFNQRPKVTNAKGGQSIHNYGLAFDIVLLYDNNKDGKFEEASWSMTKDIDKDKVPEWFEVVNYFKSKGWEWGGDWKSFKDNPHFQLKKKNGTSYKWQELSKLVKFTDNGLVYPTL